MFKWLICIFVLLPFFNFANAFFSNNIILNCSVKSNYYPDTYQRVQYIKFNKKKAELNWSPVEKKFLEKRSPIIEFREANYKIILYPSWDRTEIISIDRTSGIMSVDLYYRSISSDTYQKLRKTSLYNCKKISQFSLPKKNIKKKF